MIIQLTTKNINHWAKQIASKGSPWIVDLTNEAVVFPSRIENDYFEDPMGDEIFKAVIALDKVPKSS